MRLTGNGLPRRSTPTRPHRPIPCGPIRTRHIRARSRSSRSGRSRSNKQKSLSTRRSPIAAIVDCVVPSCNIWPARTFRAHAIHCGDWFFAVGILASKYAAEMMDDFTSAEIETGESTIFVRSHGAGPPILLLHGFPQTHLNVTRCSPRCLPATSPWSAPICAATDAAPVRSPQPRH
jgi:hypothetical protein